METVAVSATKPKIVRKNQDTLPPRLLSQPYHDVEVCREREVFEAKGNHGSILRQPCRYHLKGTCTRTSCEYWHPPECQFYQNETGCKAGDKCLFPHYKVDEQPKKSRKRAASQKEEKVMTRMLWLLRKVYHNWVGYHKIQMHSFLKVESLRETRCRKSWNQFKGYDSLSLRYVMRVSGKRKDHRWEK